MKLNSVKKLRLGSRASELALWQANWVKAQLEQHYRGLEVEIVLVKTHGDRVVDSPLSKIGAKGIFTREIDEALLRRQIDLSVHSLKDLPTEIAAGISITAVTKREDIHDVFVSHPKKGYRSLDDLPKGSKLATSSLRRKCQLLHFRPDFEIVDIRGNVTTRLQKLDGSDWDGLVLAMAGLTRLGLTDRITQVIPTDVILPAVGQGALAIESRSHDQKVQEIARGIDDDATAVSTRAERTLLAYLEGGCQVPIGAYARMEDGVFKIDALIGSVDGKHVVRSAIHGDSSQADRLAIELAEILLQAGGQRILTEIRSAELKTVPSV